MILLIWLLKYAEASETMKIIYYVIVDIKSSKTKTVADLASSPGSIHG